ncbi:MAG TPA: 50S ribosomal protein L29 [Saprospiraceae bacterium]|nr:50S ribosomal protein L29 [Saprospiraceae bacterium]
MASDKMNELKSMTMDELKTHLMQLEVAYNDSKFDHATMGLENPLELRGKRREIAQIKTVIREQELAEMTPELLAKRSKIVQRRKKRR